MTKIIQPTAGSRGTYRHTTPKTIEFGSGESLGLWDQDVDAPLRDVTTFWRDPNGRFWARQFQQASATSIPSGGLYQKVIENDFEIALVLDQTPIPDLAFHTARLLFETGN